MNQRTLRTGIIWTAIAVAFFVSAVAVFLESGVFTPRLIRFLNDRLVASDLEIRLESMNLRPWTGITLHGVELSTSGEVDASADPDAPPVHDRIPLAAVGQIEVGYRFFGLLFGTPRIDRLKVVRPDVSLDELLRWDARVSDEDDRAASSAAGSGGRGVRVDDLEIVDGRLHSGSLDLSALRLAGSLDASGGRWALDVDDAGGRLQTERVDEDLELTGLVALEGGVIDVEGLHLSVAGGRVSFEGVFGDPDSSASELRATGFGIPLDRVGAWFGAEHPLLTGPLEFRLVISGEPNDLDVAGDLSAVAADGNERRVRFAAHRHESGLTIDTLQLTAGDSRLDLHGQLMFGAADHALGMAVFESLAPAVVLAEPDLEGVEDLHGYLRFEGRGTTRETFDGSAELQLERAVVFGFPLDGVQADLTMHGGELVLTKIRVSRGRSEITGFGSLDPDNRLSADFRGTVADLSDIGAAGDSSTTPLAGQAAIDVHFVGPVKAPTMNATLEFADADVFGATARTLAVKLRSEALGDDSEFVIDAVGTDVGYGGRVLPRATASGSWRSGALQVTDLQLESDRRGLLRLTGNLAISGAGNLSGRVTKLAMQSASGDVEWKNEGPIRVERTKESLTFSGLDLRSGTGRVAGDVSVHSSGEAFVRATGRQVDLSLFGPFVLTPHPLGGVLTFDANAIVGADTLAADISIELHDGAYGDDSLERLDGRLHLEDTKLVLQDVVLRSSIATADVSGEITLGAGTFRDALADSASRREMVRNLEFHDVRAALDSRDLTPVLSLIRQIRSPAGRGSVVANVQGAADSLVVEFRAEIEDGLLGMEPLDKLTAEANFREGILTIEQCLLQSGEGTLTAQGSVPIEWSLLDIKPRVRDGSETDLAFEATQFPVRGLTVVASLFEVGEGDLVAQGRFRGPPGALYLDGSFELTNARMAIPTFTDPLVQGLVRGNFDRRGVQITEGTFSDGRGGKVKGTGRIELVNFSATGMRLEMNAQDYHYRGLPGIVAEGSGTIIMTGRRTSEGKLVPHFGGDVHVLKADLDERILLPPAADELAVPEGVTLPENATRPSPADSIQAPVVLADITFSAEENVWLRTREIDSEVAGRITLHMTEDYIGPTGQARTLRGTYTLLNNEFNIKKAEVQFTDASNVETAYIDAIATTRVLDEDVTVIVSGTLGNPLIQSSTNSGMSETEIYELLALRQKRDDPTVEGESQGLVSSDLWESYGATLASRFGRQLSSELGFDTFDVEAEGGKRTVGIGKYLGSGLFLQYRRDISSGETAEDAPVARESLETPREQLVLEYRLNNIFQLEGETGIIQDEEYLNVDLRAEWGY